ncbi:telomere zinc finger-associated protein-like [Hyalella azteca]|uniref:Telomere zinc finger-associated protein-like n=1 Tax=Hyalella azteca TaxID=294128 RepID=A0A979FXG0_HYAAZ|nr:telomere zinc finger-associated protein-like [Hyalella azteca]
MAYITKECRVMLHQLSDAAVCSGKRPEPRLSQASSAGKVKAEALEMVDPSPVIKVSAISIKKELDDETEDISIKEEPFLYGNESCSTENLSHAPAFSSCLPCKTEAQVEEQSNHPSSSQNISAPLVNQCGVRGSAPASGDAADVAGISGASNSEQLMRLSCSQRGLVPAGAGQLQQQTHQEHLASGPHHFSHCDYTSSSGSGLQQNINAMHSIKDSLQCQDCDYTCTTKKLMQKHIACKHFCRSKNQCHFSLNSCATKAEPKQHILLRHPLGNSQKFSCKYADGCKQILRKCGLSQQPTMKKFGCSECDFACTTKGSLKRHFLYKHSTEKPVQCSECDYACNTKYDLKKHFLQKHSTEKPFQCCECDFACTTKGSLKRHFLYKHSTEKPVQCSECDYACTTKDDLKIHYLHKHSTEKPFQCSKCNYACTVKGNLKRHFLVKHSTEKPYKCSVQMLMGSKTRNSLTGDAHFTRAAPAHLLGRVSLYEETHTDIE